ncbi:16S rRNA (adenine(1518)-N(6)/adenine(1519)-N(6))-dimethyltransferase RsmA, partial [Patescibacteria group bacterium]|nr:16S rRNA (adenine(1518)-N(6)/adenine(1519)-N(6))-dimethyltransferase RsmA [Patescibacteria group bacterium]
WLKSYRLSATTMKRQSTKQRGAKLGQHFLTNAGIARIVAESSGAAENVRVYEIGPGKGMLTKELLALGASVTAVEKDPEMSAILHTEFAAEIKKKTLTVIEGDARDYTPDAVFPKGEYVIAANIPYYITGELIRTALTSKNQPKAVALLIQKEVAERIARSKKESLLSLSVKAYGTPKYVKTVSAGSFNPPPAVDSAVLSITNISRKHFAHTSEDAFFRVIKAAFAQKRKTLGGNLKKVFGVKALEALSYAGIPEKERAENVPLALWLRVAEKIGAL